MSPSYHEIISCSMFVENLSVNVEYWQRCLWKTFQSMLIIPKTSLFINRGQTASDLSSDSIDERRREEKENLVVELEKKAKLFPSIITNINLDLKAKSLTIDRAGLVTLKFRLKNLYLFEKLLVKIIHVAEEFVVEEGGGVEMHILEDASHWGWCMLITHMISFKSCHPFSKGLELEVCKCKTFLTPYIPYALHISFVADEFLEEEKHKLRLPKHIKIKIARGHNWTGSCVTFDEFLHNPGNGGEFLELYESNNRPNLPKPP
uniref:Uncharacterized protein n=1 Tax=Cucumis melo TaxID=3656 RepID=A0A9I9EK51_CUCME